MPEEMGVIRRAGPEDVDRFLLQVRVVAARANQNGKLWVQDIDENAVRASLQLVPVYMVGDILVAFDVVYPWYSTKAVLQELVVMRLGPYGTFAQVVDLMVRTAKSADATRVVVGTALAVSDRALVRMYRKYGFNPCTEVGLQREVV